MWMWVAASMLANFKRIQNHRGANAIACVLLCFALAGAARANAAGLWTDAPSIPFALRGGESITYSVRWGFIPSVGRIKISAEQIGTGDQAVLRVTTLTSTYGIARGLLAFDGRGESVYQLKSGMLLSSSEWSSYRDKTVKNSIIVHYDKGQVEYTDDIHPEKTRTLNLPPGNPSDLILALIQTRSWDLQVGQKRDALVVFEDQIYPLTITAEDYDYVFTSLGVFKAVGLVPRMEKTAPLGMFRKGSTVKVWIETDDNRRLPVRFSVGFRFGTGTATLIEYQPPK